MINYVSKYVSKKEALKNRKIFTDALRSEKYKQGTLVYRRNDEFCWLGVLKDVLDKGEWKPVASGPLGTTYNKDILTAQLIRLCGLPDHAANILISANDGDGDFRNNQKSFTQIADMIDSFEVYGLEIEDIPNVYGEIEKRLKSEGFKVHHLMRDWRLDWGDDGGYIISISSKDNIIYLHILEVNYNYTVDIHKLCETGDGEQRAYIICDSIDNAQQQLNELVETLDNMSEDDYNDASAHDFVDKRFLNFYNKMICIVAFAYSENPIEEKNKILSLSSTPYIENFTTLNYDQ